MALKTIVKVGGITNLSDARYCAGMGVDMLGFCLNTESSNHIDIEKIKEIVGWVSGVEIIAEFENESIAEIQKTLSYHSFDGILTNNFDCALHFQAQGIKTIFEVVLNNEEALLKFQKDISKFKPIDFIQISCENISLFSAINHNLSEWSRSINILKSFDNNLDDLLNQCSNKLFKGISLTGTHEEKPGLKDYDEIADILETLEDDD